MFYGGAMRLTVTGLGAVLVISPLLFGSVHGWAAGMVEVAVFALGLGWFLARGAEGAGSARAFAGVGAALVAVLALHAVPLPPGVVSALSPGAAEVYRRTVDARGEEEGARREIREAGAWEEERVPVAARERIAEVAARPARGWAPEGWRTLALNPVDARGDLLRYLACGVVLWMAATVPAPFVLLRAVVASGAIVSLVAIVQALTWNGRVLWVLEPYDRRTFHPRLSGPFVNADHFAMFVEMTLVAGAGWLLWRVRHRRGSGEADSALGLAALGVALAVTAAGLFGSASRGGISGTLLGLAVLWLGVRGARGARKVPAAVRGRARRNRLERWRAWGRRLAPAAVMAVVIVGGLGYAGSEARDILDERLGRTILRPDLHVRTILWEQTAPMIADFWLLGVGPGNWKEHFRRYEAWPMIDARPNHAHNDYVEWAAEVGIVGVALTLALVWAFVRVARRNDAIPRTLRFGLAGAIVAVAWHSLFDFGLRQPANGFLLAALLGLLCNRWWKGREEGESGVELSRRPGLVAAGVAVAVFAVLALGALGQVREFLQWRSALDGSADLAFAPETGDTWYRLGMHLYRSGFRYEPPTAECFRAAVERQPTNEAAWWRLALTATTLEERRRAMATAVFLDPTRASWRLSYARVLALLGRGEEALAEVEEAAFRAPVLYRHPYLAGGETEASPEVLAAAERGFRRAIEWRPGEPQLHGTLAAFYDRGERYAEAAEAWERAAVASGNWAEYGRRAGESRARGGDYGGAEKLFRRAIRDDVRRPDAYRALALSVYRSAKRYLEAEEVLELGIRRVRDDVPLLEALFVVRRERGDEKGALAALARAAELRPRDASLQSRLGSAYLAGGDVHRAAIALERALALDPERPELHHQKGAVLERRYDLAGARDAYRRALELAPANAAYRESLERVESAFGAAPPADATAQG